jgi:hypothetical protein
MENRVSSRVQRFTGSQGSGLWVAQVARAVGLRRFGRRNTEKRAGHRHWRLGFTGSRSLGHGLVGSGLRFRRKPPLICRISLWLSGLISQLSTHSLSLSLSLNFSISLFSSIPPSLVSPCVSRKEEERKSNEEGRWWRKERKEEELIKRENNLPCKLLFPFFFFFFNLFINLIN